MLNDRAEARDHVDAPAVGVIPELVLAMDAAALAALKVDERAAPLSAQDHVQDGPVADGGPCPFEQRGLIGLERPCKEDSGHQRRGAGDSGYAARPREQSPRTATLGVSDHAVPVSGALGVAPSQLIEQPSATWVSFIRFTSNSSRRSAVWAACSVAATVPGFTPSASAIAS